MTNAERSLGELATAYPAAAKVFQKHRLDYCCGGKQSLVDACAAQDLDVEEVLQAIEAAQKVEEGDIRWDERPLGDLIQHILDRYHAPLRTEIPRLIELAG